MIHRPLVCVISIFGLVFGEQVALKLPFSKDDQVPHAPKIAIIGAGIAGASAAYELHDQYSHADFDLAIYEANPQVGGRIKSAKVYDGAYTYQQVETGAQSFYADDECVQSLIDETGLRRKLEPHYPVKKSVGVWDGATFILRGEGDLKARTWTDWARYAWTYGFSVNNLRKWLSEKLPLFRRLLGRWEYASRNIPRDIQDLGLTAELKSNAWSLLQNLTSPDFLREIVQATTRAWFSQDLATMDGLAALVAINPAATDSIMNGGNHKLIGRLIKLSDVDLHLNSTVTKIQRSPVRKYRLTIKTPSHYHDQSSSDNEEADYDAIIIAAPLQMANIEFDIDIHVAASPPRPYASRHVTHFTSSEPLSPTYFNLSSSSSMPSKIYTTTSAKIPPPPFFSIEHSFASLGLDGCIAQSENMYKVVTASPLLDATILSLLGHDPDRALEDAGVRWVHREEWKYAFLEHDRGAMLDDFEIADGMFYTGVGEEVVSSLEMSCKMGRRAATLLYYEKFAPEVEP
ncbi:MAG: hypothetical protein Q9225_007494 [Loekoesia sp. 1 TL-2023]